MKRTKKQINGQHTTLAARAVTSRSEGTETRVQSTDAISEGESKAISLLHSVARARKIANEISRELKETSFRAIEAYLR